MALPTALLHAVQAHTQLRRLLVGRRLRQDAAHWLTKASTLPPCSLLLATPPTLRHGWQDRRPLKGEKHAESCSNFLAAPADVWKALPTASGEGSPRGYCRAELPPPTASKVSWLWRPLSCAQGGGSGLCQADPSCVAVEELEPRANPLPSTQNRAGCHFRGTLRTSGRLRKHG